MILKNCRILDGTGNPWYGGDIAIENERISRISRTDAIKPAIGDEVLDIDGKAVCPGFIDIHTHSDTVFLLDKFASSKICQGVTTEVVGNCGMSCAPIVGEGGKTFVKVNAGLFGEDLAIKWESMAEYLRVLERNQLPINIASMVGHSTVRACAMGYAIKSPSKAEKHEMKRLLEESLQAGSFGMSLGYKPGEQADEDELVFLGRIVGENGGFLASHSAQLSLEKCKSKGGDTYEELTKKIQELIRVGQRAKVPVQISHVKAIGPVAWGRANWITDLIDQARAKGIDVTCDLYGYTTGGGSLIGLFAPEFLLESTHSQDLQEVIKSAIRDSPMKRKALNEIELQFHQLGGADKVRMVSFPANHDVDGKTFLDISEEVAMSPAELVLQFLQEGDARLQCEVMIEKDVVRLMKHHTAMICSDAISMSIEGSQSKGMVHPRTFGAFPRILRHYVLELGTLSLPEAIRKMTSSPAQRLGLQERGRIEENYYADIVVFDPKEVADRATFFAPYQFPKGIKAVFVNGALAVSDGKYNRTLTGKVLRKATG